MSIKGALMRFAGWYILLTAIALFVFELFEIKANSGVNAGILLGATSLACYGFIKINNRVFTATEKRFALWGMLAVDLTFQAITTAIALPAFKQGVLLPMASVFLVIGAIHLGLICLGIYLSNRDFSKRSAAQT